MEPTESYSNLSFQQFGNLSTESGPSSQGLSAVTIVQVTILGLCTLMIVVSNTFILVILHKVRNCFEEMQQLIFKALAITDFLTGIFCCGLTMLAIIFGITQSFSSAMCAVRGAACTGLTNLSALLITCACMDRFVAVVFPLRYPSFVTMKRAKIMLLVVCAVAILNAGLSTLRGRTLAKNNLCLSDFSSERLAFRPSLVTSLLIFSTTLILTSYFNIKVLWVATTQHRRMVNRVAPSDIADGATSPKVEQNGSGSLKSLRVLIVATISFFIAIFPWSVISASQFSRNNNFASPMARYVSSVFLLSNSWVNAVIFFAFNKRFRRAVKKVVFRGQLEAESTIMTETLNSID